MVFRVEGLEVLGSLRFPVSGLSGLGFFGFRVFRV